MLVLISSFAHYSQAVNPNELDLDAISKLIEEYEDEDEDGDVNIEQSIQEKTIVLADLGSNHDDDGVISKIRFNDYEAIRSEFHDAVRGGNARRVAQMLRSGMIRNDDIKAAKETAKQFRLYDVQDVLNKYTSIGNNSHHGHGNHGGGGNFGINNNININDLNEKLISAVKSNDMSNVKKLLAKGANINYKAKQGFTPLMFAVSGNQLGMVRFLLGQGANKSIMNDYGMTALSLATQGNKPQIVNSLLRYGANPMEGRPSAYEIARRSGNRALMEMFKGAMIQPR